MHKSGLKSPHHCGTVNCEQQIFKEAVRPDFCLLVASTVWILMPQNGPEILPRATTSFAPHCPAIVRILTLATSKENGKTYL